MNARQPFVPTVPNRTATGFVTLHVQSVSDHPWLQSSNAPAPWGPPSPQSSPPPPPPSSVAPAPPPLATPPPHQPPAGRTGYSGYDAPPPDSRWHTYLQLNTTPGTQGGRPSVPLSGWLAIVGAALVALGSFLPWGSFPRVVETLGFPRAFTGFSRVGADVNDGPYFVGIAVIVAVFGVVTLLGKRRLPLMIVGVVFTALGAIAAVIDFADVADVGGDIPPALEPSTGPGLPIVIAGFVLALGGFVVGIAKRRR